MFAFKGIFNIDIKIFFFGLLNTQKNFCLVKKLGDNKQDIFQKK